jgi:hypothetical protein
VAHSCIAATVSSLVGFLVAVGRVLLVIAVGEVLLVVEVRRVLLEESWLFIFVAHKI